MPSGHDPQQWNWGAWGKAIALAEEFEGENRTLSSCDQDLRVGRSDRMQVRWDPGCMSGPGHGKQAWHGEEQACRDRGGEKKRLRSAWRERESWKMCENYWLIKTYCSVYDHTPDLHFHPHLILLMEQTGKMSCSFLRSWKPLSLFHEINWLGSIIKTKNRTNHYENN